MKNVAIVYSGICRNLDRTYRNHQKKIFDPLISKNLNIFIFAHFWSEPLINIQLSKIDLKFSSMNITNPEKLDIPFNPDIRFSHPKQNILSMFKSLYYSYQLLDNYKNENSIEFDIVIRMRTDDIFFDEIILENYNLEKINLHAEFAHTFYGVNDHFALGPISLMHNYFDVYNHIENHLKNGAAFNPETLLGYHLRIFTQTPINYLTIKFKLLRDINKFSLIPKITQRVFELLKIRVLHAKLTVFLKKTYTPLINIKQKKGDKLKLALVFYGQPRFLNNKFANSSITRHLLSRYQCHIYYSFWLPDENGYTVSTWSKINDLPIVNNNDFDLFDNYFDPQKKELLESKKFSFDDEIINYFRGFLDTNYRFEENIRRTLENQNNVLSQLKSISNAVSLIENPDYYDYIVLVRPDSFIHSLDHSEIKKHSKVGKTVLIPNHHSGFPDNIIFLSSDLINWPKRLFVDLDKYFHRARFPSPEELKYSALIHSYPRTSIVQCKNKVYFLRSKRGKI